MDSSKNTWSSYTFDLNNFDQKFPNVSTDTSSKFKTKWMSHINPFGEGQSFWHKVIMYILVIGAIVFMALVVSGYTWSSNVLQETKAAIASSFPSVTVTPIPNVTPYQVRAYNDENDVPSSTMSASTLAPKATSAAAVSTTSTPWNVKAANDF